MARTLAEIYNALAITKSEQPELSSLQPDIDTTQTLLSDLTTPSRVARWRLFFFVVAVAIWTHEKLWDIFRAEVIALAAAAHPGTVRWYVEKALQFQFGHPLVIVNGVPTYEVDAPLDRIVSRAAGGEGSGQVLVKVAKTSGGGLAPLDVAELAAFEEYMDQVKFAGTIVQVISEVADLVKVPVTVFYDPLVMAADGSLLLDPATKPVEDAIRAHLANLPFNGALVLTDLVDAMQRAEGVRNPVLGNVQAKYGLFPYGTITVRYVARAGYMTVDPLNDLNTTITYLPYVD